MSTEPGLSDTIRENAGGVKRAKGDNGELEHHSLQDQIAADRYLCSKEAAKRKGRGLGFSKFVPPGTT